MSIPPPPSKTTRQHSVSGASGAGHYFENGSTLPMVPALAGGGTLMPLSVESSVVASTSGAPFKSDFSDVNQLQPHSHDTDEDDQSGSVSVSSEDDGKEDSELDNQLVAENVSSKVSNRSSPSVLSATIHQWPGYEEESHGLLENNNDESSEASSEENEDPDDPWRISPEQRGWYLSLFLRLQSDVHGFIEGKDARVFFENSQLPLHDLGEIWNCSDVDRDGRLSLAEFCYAMHLSVARRHGLVLPLQLPSSLKNSTRHILKAADGSGGEARIFSSGDYTHQPEWTKFSESPRSRGAGGGGGPVQFRSTVEAESQIAHPTAVKASPKSSSSNVRTSSSSTVRDARSFSTGTVTSNLSLAASAKASPGQVGAHPVAVQESAINAMAPPPPPRSFHSRSASLDLQGQTQMPGSAGKGPLAGPAAPPPQLPPRSSPITSKRLESETSESENESSRIATSLPSTSDLQPKKPPRVNKTPNRNVSFAVAGEHRTWASSLLNSLPALLDVNDLSFPSLQDIDRMKSSEVWNMVERLKSVTEGLSRQNIDLQQQLTDVVLKKRTAEVHLAGQVQREKNAHSKS